MNRVNFLNLKILFTTFSVLVCVCMCSNKLSHEFEMFKKFWFEKRSSESNGFGFEVKKN